MRHLRLLKRSNARDPPFVAFHITLHLIPLTIRANVAIRYITYNMMIQRNWKRYPRRTTSNYWKASVEQRTAILWGYYRWLAARLSAFECVLRILAPALYLIYSYLSSLLFHVTPITSHRARSWDQQRTSQVCAERGQVETLPFGLSTPQPRNHYSRCSPNK